MAASPSSLTVVKQSGTPPSPQPSPMVQQPISLSAAGEPPAPRWASVQIHSCARFRQVTMSMMLALTRRRGLIRLPSPVWWRDSAKYYSHTNGHLESGSFTVSALPAPLHPARESGNIGYLRLSVVASTSHQPSVAGAPRVRLLPSPSTIPAPGAGISTMTVMWEAARRWDLSHHGDRYQRPTSKLSPCPSL